MFRPLSTATIQPATTPHHILLSGGLASANLSPFFELKSDVSVDVSMGRSCGGEDLTTSRLEQQIEE